MKHHNRIARTAFALALVAGSAAAQGEPRRTVTCGVEPSPSALVFDYLGSGGMNGWGWDGFGPGSAFLTFHMEGSTPDMGPNQRAQIIASMQQWANVADIMFVEIPVPNLSNSIDFDFLTGDHSNVEPHEAGDPDCAFDGFNGTLAHAAFPPGAGSKCGGASAESFAGNVHFDEAETWSLVVNPGGAGLDILSVSTHEVGHALGLVHSFDSDIMGPTFGTGVPFPGLTSNDINNIQSGYASGPGFVVTLEASGVWVDASSGFPWFGNSTNPFALFFQGVGGVPPQSVGVTVHVDAGTYDEPAILIDQNMLIVAEGGSVIVR